MSAASAGPTAADLLEPVIRAARDAGERLREEFFRPTGPRGERGKAPVDTEIEESLRATLQSLLAGSFLGEETGLAAGPIGQYRWVVDPHDGTNEFLKGNRGSAVSIALLRGARFSDSAPEAGAAKAEVALGVVHCPLAPDRGPDTIAWAQGCGPIRRNGRPLEVDLSRARLERGAIVWTTASAARRPHAFSRALAPARFVAMPSIAYRLARIAAGDGAATLSLHSVNEYDIAAGAALVRAAGGVLHDAEGREIAFTGARDALVPGCIAGAPDAVRDLAGKDWESVLREPRIAPRMALGFPRSADDARLARAQGCLLGQLIGDSLGSRVGFQIAGQPAAAGELALALARSIARHRRYDASAAFAAYQDWLASGPFDVGDTTRAGISGKPDPGSTSSGSLMRVSPIGIWAAGDPARAARAAREDSALTHPNPVCLEACAGYAAAIGAGVAGGTRADMLAAALAHCGGEARAAIGRASQGARPGDHASRLDRVLVALQNAFYQLHHARSFEAALIATASAGGDTDSHGAVAGALAGALHGRTAIPQRWLLSVLSCRPSADCGVSQARPTAYWPDDVLDLAEGLIAA